MSEEEKKAIEELEEFIEDDEIENISVFTAKKIKNIIDNRQKEIEELKDIQQEMCEKEIINQKHIKENYISKDKIREKIKELEE